MPRRPRVREYEEVVEPVSHHRRARRKPPIEEDIQFPYRAPSPPPIDKFERLRLRELPRRARKEAELPPPPPRVVKHLADEFGHHRHREPRVPGTYETEDEIVSEEEPVPKYPASDHDNDDEPLAIPRRRSLPPRELLRDPAVGQEIFRRSKSSHKKGGRVRRREYEEEDYIPRGEELHRRHRTGHRYSPPARLRRASGYQTDSDSEVEEDVRSPSARRSSRPETDIVETEEFIPRGSRRSSPESDDSSDHRAIPMPSRHRGSVPQYIPPRENYSRPPRAPSPEVSFEEPRIRQRESRGRSSHQDLREQRPPTGPPSPASRLSPASPSPDEGSISPTSKPLPRHSPSQNERDIPSDATETDSEAAHEEPESDKESHQHGGGESPAQVDIRRNSEDDWAIVNANSRSRHSSKETLHEREPKRSSQRSKPQFEEEEGPGGDAEPGRGKIARRYIGLKDKREDLWTEITKDLVVKEAIERTGYEYEETPSSYYIFSYLQYDDVSALVELSEDIRQARRRRIQEIYRERASMAPPPPRGLPEKTAPPPPPLADREAVPSPARYHRPYGERRVREREVLFDDGLARPPLPRPSRR